MTPTQTRRSRFAPPTANSPPRPGPWLPLAAVSATTRSLVASLAHLLLGFRCPTPLQEFAHAGEVGPASVRPMHPRVPRFKFASGTIVSGWGDPPCTAHHDTDSPQRPPRPTAAAHVSPLGVGRLRLVVLFRRVVVPITFPVITHLVHPWELGKQTTRPTHNT